MNPPRTPKSSAHTPTHTPPRMKLADPDLANVSAISSRSSREMWEPINILIRANPLDQSLDQSLDQYNG